MQTILFSPFADKECEVLLGKFPYLDDFCFDPSCHTVMKNRLEKEEQVQLFTFCIQLKLESSHRNDNSIEKKVPKKIKNK